MRVLAVCLGNICRSPTAEAAIREAAVTVDLDIELDSAGTGDWHIGSAPDPRMVRAAADAGLRLTGRARTVTGDDLEHFDLVLAMDRSNLHRLQELAATDEQRAKIVLFRTFEDGVDDPDVPDPYIGEPEDFARVVEICRAAAEGLVRHLRRSGSPDEHR